MFIIRSGKKIKACKVFREAMVLLAKNNPKESPYTILEKAVRNLTPVLGTHKLFVSGKRISLFSVSTPKQLDVLGIKWLVKQCVKNRKCSFSENLAFEIWNASNRKGFAYQIKIKFYKKNILI